MNFRSDRSPAVNYRPGMEGQLTN